MRQQALVIGLGQFGMAVARSLSKRGLEVLAVDRRQDLVDAAVGFAAEVLVLDATDEAALAQARPAARDLTVCAIGEDAKDASIICTALLRQYGSKRVIARAADPVHERILKMVGAHHVVNPETEMGERLANRLVYESIVSDMPLGDGLWVTEFKAPPAFVAQSLQELELPRKHSVMVIAIRRPDGGVLLPTADLRVEEGESLVVVSKEKDLKSLLDEVKS